MFQLSMRNMLAHLTTNTTSVRVLYPDYACAQHA